MTRHTTLSPILLVTSAVTAPAVVAELVPQKLPDYNPDQVIWLSPPDQTPSIEELRQWMYGLSYRLGSDEFRVYVIPQLNHAPVELSHALLKTLEEPPDRTLILLTVDSTHGLLSTLLSRCQIHHGSSVNTDQDQWQLLARQLADRLPTDSVYQLWSLLPRTINGLQAVLLLSHLSRQLLSWRLQPAGRQMLQAILVAISQLEQNTHVRLTAENCLLQLYLLAKAVKIAPKTE